MEIEWTGSGSSMTPALYRSLQATGSGVQENGDFGYPNPEHMGVPKTIAALVVINIPIEEF